MRSPVVGVVDHDLVFVSVAKEDVGDHVGAVAVDDLVKEIGWVGERVRPVPACDMDQCSVLMGEDLRELPLKTCATIQTRSPASSAACSSSMTNLKVPDTSGLEVLIKFTVRKLVQMQRIDNITHRNSNDTKSPS